LGPLTIHGSKKLDHKVPKSHVSFRCSRRAGADRPDKLEKVRAAFLLAIN